MARFMITLPPMPKEQVMSSWKAVVDASVGSDLKMETAYVDENKGQAICVWEAPDQQAIDDLFAKAQVTPESVRQVVEYRK